MLLAREGTRSEKKDRQIIVVLHPVNREGHIRATEKKEEKKKKKKIIIIIIIIIIICWRLIAQSTAQGNLRAFH